MFDPLSSFIAPNPSQQDQLTSDIAVFALVNTPTWAAALRDVDVRENC